LKFLPWGDLEFRLVHSDVHWFQQVGQQDVQICLVIASLSLTFDDPQIPSMFKLMHDLPGVPL
jgi:hypothetical protein